MCTWKKTQGHAEVLQPDQGLLQHNRGISGTQLYSFSASSDIFGQHCMLS